MIKAIFFDLDGVLTINKNGTINVCDNLSKLTGIDKDKLLECHWKIGKPIINGLRKYSDDWDTFCECIGKKIDINLLQDAFRATPMNKETLNMVSKLRGNYKVGIITDNTNERITALEEEHKLKEKFDIIITSSRIHSDKKEEKIFEEALQGLKPEECVFIDNGEKNLEVPRKMGIKTIHWESGQPIKKLEQALKENGVEL